MDKYTDILKQSTVLYVEDEKEVRENIAEYLETFFHKVYITDNGIDALKLFKQQTPDLLILDINIPKIDGLNVAKLVREINQKTHIVMLTAQKDEETLLDAIPLKLTQFLVKPVSPAKFEMTLESVAKSILDNSENMIFLDKNREYCFDTINHKLYHNKDEVELSIKEAHLCALLVENFKQTVSVETIMVYVWEDYFEEDISKDSVKSLVSSLRKKLYPEAISNVYGVGYILR